jgi:hypothetical protein
MIVNLAQGSEGRKNHTELDCLLRAAQLKCRMKFLMVSLKFLQEKMAVLNTTGIFIKTSFILKSHSEWYIRAELKTAEK